MDKRMDRQTFTARRDGIGRAMHSVARQKLKRHVIRCVVVKCLSEVYFALFTSSRTIVEVSVFGRLCMLRCTLCRKKVSHLPFDNNFGKCGPTLKILSRGHSYENSLCINHKDFHFTCNMLLHYLVKIENPKKMLLTAPQQTVDMFLRTLWGLDLTFHSS